MDKVDKGELFFEIPNDLEQRAKIIEAVPGGWMWTDGQLIAPQQLIVSGEATKNSGFRIPRFDIIGRRNSETDPAKNQRDLPDVFAMMVERKMPGFVDFELAGFGYTPFPEVIRLAAGFIRRGYEGFLSAYLRDHRNNKYDNPACWNMMLAPWMGAPALDEPGPQPARIHLEWNGRYGGSPEDIEPIVAICRSLGLKEYIPAARPQAPILHHHV